MIIDVLLGCAGFLVFRKTKLKVMSCNLDACHLNLIFSFGLVEGGHLIQPGLGGSWLNCGSKYEQG